MPSIHIQKNEFTRFTIWFQNQRTRRTSVGMWSIDSKVCDRGCAMYVLNQDGACNVCGPGSIVIRPQTIETRGYCAGEHDAWKKKF